MAVILNGSGADYRGLSTDVKPTEMVAVNSIYLELDTGNFYYFDGTTWNKIGG
jgi:hypothetical protein